MGALLYSPLQSGWVDSRDLMPSRSTATAPHASDQILASHPRRNSPGRPRARISLSLSGSKIGAETPYRPKIKRNPLQGICCGPSPYPAVRCSSQTREYFRNCLPSCESQDQTTGFLHCWPDSCCRSEVLLATSHQIRSLPSQHHPITAA